MLALRSALLALGLLALFAGWAASQQPTEKSEPPPPIRLHSPEPNQRASPPNQTAAQPPIVVNVLPTPKSEIEKEEEGREKQEKTETDRKIVDLTAALARFTEYLFYATAVLGFVGLCTLAALIWQGRQMKRAVEIAESGIRISERAILWADSWTVRNIGIGQVPVIEYKLKNSGRTHAEVIAIHAGYGISAEDMVPVVPPYSAEDPLAPGIVGPGAAVDMEFTLKEALTSQEYSDIQAARAFIFLFGKVTFRDEFRWTCEVAYGAQVGSYKDGKPSVTFMKRPGYTFVTWRPPKREIENH